MYSVQEGLQNGFVLTIHGSQGFFRSYQRTKIGIWTSWVYLKKINIYIYIYTHAFVLQRENPQRCHRVNLLFLWNLWFFQLSESFFVDQTGSQKNCRASGYLQGLFFLHQKNASACDCILYCILYFIRIQLETELTKGERLEREEIRRVTYDKPCQSPDW